MCRVSSIGSFCPTGLSRLCCLPHEDRSLSDHPKGRDHMGSNPLSVVHKGFMPGCGVDHDVRACLGPLS